MVLLNPEVLAKLCPSLRNSIVKEEIVDMEGLDVLSDFEEVTLYRMV